MANDSIFIFDNKKNKEIIREMTDDEQAMRDTEVAAYLEKQTAKQIADNEKIEAKRLLLQKLGITEEEAKLLLG